MKKIAKPYAAKIAGIAADYIEELSSMNSNGEIQLSDYITRDEAVILSEAIDALREFEQGYTSEYRGY